MILMCSILRKFDISRLPTSPLYCSHFALGNPKSYFQQCYSYILQIICIISEENKLLLPYPRQLKNVTSLPCKMPKFFVFFNFFHAYRVPIRNMDELRKRLVVATWAEFQQSVVDDAVDQW